MSRPPLPPTDLVEDNPLTTSPTKDLETTRLIEQARVDAFEFGVSVGKSDAMLFIATVADKTAVIEYKKIKKSREYIGLRYKDSEGKVRHVATFDEFCRARWGKSYRRMQEIAANFELIGEELYEQAERLGLQQRDYNAIRALPQEDQDIIKQAIESGERPVAQRSVPRP